ncbi:MAG: hypothetical protein EZS28_054237, partial [Streblomastix strix]
MKGEMIRLERQQFIGPNQSSDVRIPAIRNIALDKICQFGGNEFIIRMMNLRQKKQNRDIIRLATKIVQDYGMTEYEDADMMQDGQFVDTFGSLVQRITQPDPDLIN